ncbi:MAG: glycosyltransferase family 39 protein [Myxococcota bacterium]|nr:glycosyltransferase family 39 protein [Myxococcota bacterium]
MSPRTRSAIGAFLAVAAFSFALRAPVASLPFERDEGEYAYIAWRWLEGDVPYRDAFDQKPPGIFAVYALAFAIGGERPAAARWTAQGLLLVLLAALLALARRRGTPEAGVPAALFAAALAVDWTLLGNAVNTETLAIAPLGGAAWTAWLARAAPRGALGAVVATGALGGIALLMKPVVAPIVAFLLLTAVWGRRALGPLLAGGAVAALPALLAAAYFAAQGAFAPFFDATVLNNLVYAGGMPLSEYPRYFWGQLGDGFVAFAPLYAAAALAPLAGRGARGPSVGWIAGWLGVSLLAVSAGGFFRRHYLLLAVPPLALLAGLGVAGLARRIAPQRAAPWLAAGLALGGVAYTVAHSPWYYAPGDPEAKLVRIYGSNPFPEAVHLGAWLGAHSEPDDRVFVYGSEPQLLFYARRRSASRYIYVYPLNMPFGRPLERQREVLDALRADPPRYLVASFLRTSQLTQAGTPPALRQGLRELVASDYEIAAVVPFARDRSTRILEGKPARTMWRERPLWDGATPWAPFVVWERQHREGDG